MLSVHFRELRTLKNRIFRVENRKALNLRNSFKTRKTREANVA